MIEKVKVVADVSAWGVIGAALVQWLPPIAAGLAVLWHLTQFYFLIKDRSKKKRK